MLPVVIIYPLKAASIIVSIVVIVGGEVISMVRALKRLVLHIPIDDFRWLRENVPPGCIFGWIVDAIEEKMKRAGAGVDIKKE